MKKLILLGLLTCLTFFVHAQDSFLIGESQKTGKFYLKKNSFTKTIENDKVFIGATITVKKKNEVEGEDEQSEDFMFKMNIKNCSNKNGDLIQIDSNYKVVDTVPISIQGEIEKLSLTSTFAYVICATHTNFEKNPSLYENTLQTIKDKIIQEKSYEWKKLWSEKTMSYLPKYIKFEGQYVTVPILIKENDDTYYKAFINKEFCRDEAGFMELHTLNGEELKGAPFDLNKNMKESAPYIQELAIEMCKYTMANHKFRKKIVIGPDGLVTTKEATK